MASTEYPHPTLRNATLDDVDWIVQNGAKEFEGSPYSEFTVHNGKARQLIERLIVNGQKEAVVLISHANGQPVGVLAAYAFEPLFASNKIAIECLWFLEDEYRKGSRARDMMDAYEHWARLVGCTHIQYGVLSTSPKGMDRLYERAGLTCTEHIYMKRV